MTLWEIDVRIAGMVNTDTRRQRSHNMPRCLARGFAPVLVLLLMVTCPHTFAGESATVEIDMADAEHFDQLGEPGNTVVLVPLPTDAVVMGVGWSGTLVTHNESWALDADIALSDQGGEPGVTVTPGEEDAEPTPPEGTFYTSNGIIPLGVMELPGFRISSGTLEVEFAASFVDEPGVAQATWSSGTLTVEYELIPPFECPEDLNGDSVVNVSDLLFLLGEWGPCTGDCTADFDDNETVNVSDLLTLLGAWGECPEGDQPGACCFEDGTCQDLVASDCDSAGGLYQADFTACESWACEQPPDGSVCEEAIAVEVDGPVVEASTVGNPVPDDMELCGEAGTPDGNGIVWFSVVGDGTELTASTCDSPLQDTTMGVYCGITCNTAELTCIVGDEGGCDVNPFQAEVSWCSTEGQIYHIAVWGSGSSQGTVELSVASGAACKAEPICALPCDDYCGGPSPAGCWCDQLVCGEFGDCCPGVCQSCPELPVCGGGCGAVECLPGSTPENEPCGDDTNGGCNTNPNNPPRTDIVCNQPICGTLWAAGGARDTDWYRLDLSDATEATQVTISVQAELPAEMYLLNNQCPPTELAADDGCDATTTLCLDPGIYTIFVAPQHTGGFSCADGPFQYTLTAECESCTPSGNCAGICGDQAASGCWCDADCFLFEDCCPDVCDHCPETFGCN